SNGGKLLHPRYSTAVHPQIRANLTQESIWFKPVRKEDLNAIRRGMERSMSDPRSETYPASSEIIPIVGKASLARYIRTDGANANFSWFIGYTPADNPKYAIAVMIEDPKSA